jgi:hypothetical protein
MTPPNKLLFEVLHPIRPFHIFKCGNQPVHGLLRQEIKQCVIILNASVEGLIHMLLSNGE